MGLQNKQWVAVKVYSTNMLLSNLLADPVILDLEQIEQYFLCPMYHFDIKEIFVTAVCNKIMLGNSKV